MGYVGNDDLVRALTRMAFQPVLPTERERVFMEACNAQIGAIVSQVYVPADIVRCGPMRIGCAQPETVLRVVAQAHATIEALGREARQSMAWMLARRSKGWRRHVRRLKAAGQVIR